MIFMDNFHIYIILNQLLNLSLFNIKKKHILTIN